MCTLGSHSCPDHYRRPTSCLVLNLDLAELDPDATHLLNCSLQVVYALLEPLVHKYVRDLRAPQNGYSATIQKWQDLAVFVRLMTKEHAEVTGRDLT